jgi:hypothetical protein
VGNARIKKKNDNIFKILSRDKTEFLAASPEVPGSIPGDTSFSKK